MGDTIRLPLHDLHAEFGAKFVPFAAHEMPVQYTAGVMAEHLWCREKAGLFDVSHMGQVLLPRDAEAALERLVPVDVLGLAEGRQRYGLFTDQGGGILDDLMIAKRADDLFVVVNAACADADIAHLQAHIDGVAPVRDRALLAVQGPMAEAAVSALIPKAADMRFMDVAVLPWQGVDLWISRSGYTGEDGFEISVPHALAEAFARTLLAQDSVAPIGLGARDSLRLEAGLPLYGQDLSTDISPIEAGLGWAISKARRAGGARAGGFPGADRILREMTEGAARKRVGLLPEGRAPMRAGVEIYADETQDTPIGIVTSGGYGPSLGRPIAMALVSSGTPDDVTLHGDVRGKLQPVGIAPLPFRPSTYKRKSNGPEGPMKYTEDHEWLLADGDIVTVGITEYAATQLGDVVFVELPEVETQVTKGDEIVVIESVKAASDIVAPLDGEIVEVNQALVDAPSLVNEDATGEAWFFRIKVAAEVTLDGFMSEDEYKDFVGE